MFSRVRVTLLSLSLFGLACVPTPPSTSRSALRSLEFDAQHLKIEMDVDVSGQSIRGRATLLVFPLRQQIPQLILDAVDLTIEEVQVDRVVVPFDRPPGQIVIPLLPPRTIETPIEVRVTYHGSPRKGLYFVEDPPQSWTQSATEDARYWVPCMDHPGDKLTTEIIATVDSKYTAISNGALIKTTESGGKKSFHYRMSAPHATYLLSLVVGTFSKLEQKWGKIPLQAYVPVGRKADANALLRPLPKLMKRLEDFTGVPYPFEKYAQVVVDNFLTGGMENITATTLNERYLYPASERSDWARSTEIVLAHEVAHQWFGNWVSFADWRDAWLSEGFATYFGTRVLDALWSQEDVEAEFFGRLRRAIELGSRAPTISDQFNDPDELFDLRLYDRAAWILRMLDFKLGHETFAKGVREYVRRLGGRTARTEDLRRVFESVSGTDLGTFFDQWLYHGGVLRLQGSWRWDQERSAVHVDLTQAPIQGTKDQFYSSEIPIEIETSDGKTRRTAQLHGRSVTVAFPLSERPRTIRVDPDGTLLAEIEFHREIEEWILDLSHAQSLWSRLQAAFHLRNQPGPEGLAALETALRSDPHWSVRREAAKSLGTAGTPEAWDRLLRNLSGQDPVIRIQGVAALSNDARESTNDKLIEMGKSDSSSRVVAQLAEILAGRRSEKALPFLQTLRTRESHGDIVQLGLLSGFGAAKWDAGISLAKDRLNSPSSIRVRARALEVLGQIGQPQKDTQETYDLLIGYLSNSEARLRAGAVRGLGQLGNPSAVPFLEELEKKEPHWFVQAELQTALSRLRR